MPFQFELDLKGVRLRGNDHYWAVIRKFGIGNTFTVMDVANASAANKASIDPFVLRLERGGIIERVSMLDVPHPQSPKQMMKVRLYRLVRAPIETPSLRLDGSAAEYGRGRQHMWNILRGPQAREAGLDARELVLLAETDEVVIGLESAKEYLRGLARGGYLTVLQKSAHGRLTRYRLRRAMDTGPKAPKLLRAEMVFDVNRRELVGTGFASEVPE